MRPLIVAFLLAVPVQAFARAGGAGGGSSSSGGGGDFGGFGDGGDGGAIIDLVIFLLRAGPAGWLILGLIVAIALYVMNQNSRHSTYAADPGRFASGGPAPASAVHSNLEQFTAAFPGEDFNAFREKVTRAFLTIQDAWSRKKIESMRRFISDGVAQRFHAQFLMMNLLEQSNPLTDVRVHLVQVAKVRRDGAYDCVDVMIRASATDQFVCRKLPELDSPGGNEVFTEFWTFVRRVDCKTGKDIFHSESCPQCAAPLGDKLVETARCPYCGSHLNSGEFDWVLAEITQDNDYGLGLPVKSALTPPDLGVAAVRELEPGFSVQLLEDKATNAFMEVLIGNATGQAALAKRFTSAKGYEEIVRSGPKIRVAYDRLFTRVVELLRAEASGDQAKAFVGIRFSYHIVDLANPTATAILGTEPMSSLKILAMKRDYSGGAPKGSVYAGTCPSCGAPQKDNLNPLCDHCGQQLNDEKLDWVVEGILDPTQFRALDGVKQF